MEELRPLIIDKTFGIILGMIATGLFAWFISYIKEISVSRKHLKRLYETHDKREAEQEAIKEGLKGLLSDRIKAKHRSSMKEGKCPVYRLEDTLELYEPYKKLGGNGTIERVVEDMKRMEK